MNFRLFLATALLLLGTVASEAHPVAQGSMEVAVSDDHLDVSVRVSNEEVFVAGTLGKNAQTASSLHQLWSIHGTYLLQHLHFAVGSTDLTGELVKVIEPADQTTAGYAVYNLQYPLASNGSIHELGIRQDLLNEIEFAPGNPWEATFVVRISQHAQLVSEGLLLTRREPVQIQLSGDRSNNPALDRWAIGKSYLRHGINHILAGWDHLLFMSALVLAAVSFLDLIKVVTAFTFAHTVTLTLSVFNLVRLPSSIVEPMIAASIVVVAVQNVFWPQRSRGTGRLLIAFGFGLFHGLGFAGGLLEAMHGMSGVAVVIALAGFSIGVEVGHQVVVLPLFAVMKTLRFAGARDVQRQWLSRGAMQFGSCLIAIAGVIYFVSAVRG